MKIEYFTTGEGNLKIKFNGDYIQYSDDSEWTKLFKQIGEAHIKNITLDGENIKKWDSSLVVILFEIIKISKNRSIDVNLDSIPMGLKKLLNLAFSVDRKPNVEHKVKKSFLEKLGERSITYYDIISSATSFTINVLGSMIKFISGRAIIRKVDFLFAIEECGYRALPIVSVISFMVGLILAFVGSMQLKAFGAQIFVASLVGIGMVRFMGGAMTGVIMAGRTGASYAATIGTMQVNEEIDALKTMGIPIIDFLVLPRILALTITMPILSMFADIMGILGGMFVGVFLLDISIHEYWQTTINTLNLKHFLVGIFHGYVFGYVIALCGCYHGIHCGNDADSVGKATTNAVVFSIVWIVITTGILTVIFNTLGI